MIWQKKKWSEVDDMAAINVKKHEGKTPGWPFHSKYFFWAVV